MSTPGERYERWLADYSRSIDSPLLPAATVALLRQGPAGVETLIMRRNPNLRVMGGMWVFPGGRVDAADHAGGTDAGRPDDTYAAARKAAVREAHEEAGLRVDPQSLVPLSHWIPPPDFPHQLATWFFLAPAPPGAVRVDGGEIAEHVWLSPTEAIRRHTEAGGSLFLPPTYVTLSNLLPFPTVTDALAAAREAGGHVLRDPSGDHAGGRRGGAMGRRRRLRDHRPGRARRPPPALGHPWPPLALRTRLTGRGLP